MELIPCASSIWSNQCSLLKIQWTSFLFPKQCLNAFFDGVVNGGCRPSGEAYKNGLLKPRHVLTISSDWMRTELLTEYRLTTDDQNGKVELAAVYFNNCASLYHSTPCFRIWRALWKNNYADHGYRCFVRNFGWRLCE